MKSAFARSNTHAMECIGYKNDSMGIDRIAAPGGHWITIRPMGKYNE